jgi:uncharacterized protein
MNAAVVKGDLFGSLKGRLSVADRNLHDLAMVRSLGRLFYEPIWVFTREKTAARKLKKSQEQAHRCRQQTKCNAPK